jgi:hypothetical protein
MAQLNFDATQVDPQSSFDPIPAGWYKAIITESEMKDTRNGQGQYLQLTLQVLDGQYSGRHLWERLNLVNPSTAAVEIAQKTLSAICHAVGVLTPRDSAELHNRPLQVKVKVKPAEGEFEARNEISGYKAVDGKPVQAVNNAPAPQRQPAASDAPPWAK